MGQMNGRQMAAEHGAQRPAASLLLPPRPSSCLLLSLTGPEPVPCAAFMDGEGMCGCPSGDRKRCRLHAPPCEGEAPGKQSLVHAQAKALPDSRAGQWGQRGGSGRSGQCLRHYACFLLASLGLTKRSQSSCARMAQPNKRLASGEKTAGHTRVIPWRGARKTSPPWEGERLL